jgi:hypothetical protein
MHSSLHSCTFGQKAPRRSLASLEVRGAAKPLTQVRKILMNLFFHPDLELRGHSRFSHMDPPKLFMGVNCT